MSSAPKHPRAVILPDALHLVDALRPYCRRIELAGSLRREKPTVGDIEIVAVPHRPIDLFGEEQEDKPTSLDRFLDGRNLTFAKRGRKYQRFTYGRYEVDLFLPTPATWGSIFAIRTGSWEFSRWLMISQAAGGASPTGLAFIGGRLYAGGRLLLTPEESDVFAALGLAFIPPAERIGPVADPARVGPVWRFE